MRLKIFTHAMLATTIVAAGAAAQGLPAAATPGAGASDATPQPAAPAPASAAATAGAEAAPPTEGSTAAGAAPAEAPATTVAGAEAGDAGTAVEVSAPVPLVTPPPPATEPEPARKLPSFTFYGDGRLDMTYATQRMAHSNFGWWALSPSVTGGAEREDKPELVVHPRSSRLGVDVMVAEPEEGVEITAKVEIDFHGASGDDTVGGLASRELARLRHAYGQVAFGELAILGGQTWDLFAPLVYGGEEAGDFAYGGNLGERRPQLRATFSPSIGDSQLVLAGSVSQSGVLDQEDLDADGRVDGAAAVRPALEGLAEVKVKLNPEEDAKPLRVGLSFHSGAKTIGLEGIDEEFSVLAGVAHLEVPVSIVTLSAEGYLGENLSDLRGGVGQGLELRDTDGDGVVDDAKTIPGKGGFVQVQLDPVAWYSLQLGAGVDNPRGVDPGGRGLNRTLHFGNTFRPYEHFIVGAVYDYYHTDYVGSATLGKDADSHRLTAYTAVPF